MYYGKLYYTRMGGVADIDLHNGERVRIPSLTYYDIGEPLSAEDIRYYDRFRTLNIELYTVEEDSEKVDVEEPVEETIEVDTIENKTDPVEEVLETTQSDDSEKSDVKEEVYTLESLMLLKKADLIQLAKDKGLDVDETLAKRALSDLILKG